MKKIFCNILLIFLILNNSAVSADVIGGGGDLNINNTYFNDSINGSFNVTNPIENGVCGSSNGQSFSETPSQNLCTSGNTGSISGTGPWNWTCTGIAGGSDATCSANLLSLSINGNVLEKNTNNPLENVKIDLLDSSGSTINSTNTDSLGKYSFGNLVSGNYQVKEHILSGYLAFSDFDGGDPTLSNLILNSDLSDINFIQEKIINETSTGTTSTGSTNTGSTNTGTTINYYTGTTSSYTPDCSTNNLVCKELSGRAIWVLKDGVICKSELLGKDCFSIPKTNTGTINVDIEANTGSAPESNKDQKIDSIQNPDIVGKNTNNQENVGIDDIKNIVNIYENNKKLLEDIQIDENKVGNNEIIKLPKFLLQTGVPLTERTTIIKNKNVETDTNKEDFRLAGTFESDINYWLEVVPKEDRNRDLYIVLPSQGLVMPINTIEKDSNDYKKSINGEDFDFHKYLETGALEIPGTSSNSYGEVGNKVVIGHSSYYKSANGRYKTQFQKIIENEIGEEVWIYQKQSSGEYKRFRYQTFESYNTDKSDTSIILSGSGKNLILYTCTPIGGISGRWVVKAKYIDEEKNALSKKVNFSGINIKDKATIQNFANNISKEDSINTFNKTSSLLEKYSSNQKAKNYLEYLRLQLAKKAVK